LIYGLIDSHGFADLRMWTDVPYYCAYIPSFIHSKTGSSTYSEILATIKRKNLNVNRLFGDVYKICAFVAAIGI
jgi:hypothetical protein